MITGFRSEPSVRIAAIRNSSALPILLSSSSVHIAIGISPLLVTDDAMRHIRLSQGCDLFLGQFNGQGADGIFYSFSYHTYSQNRKCYKASFRICNNSSAPIFE